MSMNLQHIENEIIDQYLYDDNNLRPWIIGFSGGKDSTMMLQLVWNALKKIEHSSLKRRVYIVTNDTLVENPKIVKFIGHTLKRIQEAANLQNLPITVHETRPKVDDTFWVRLIGLGYPAPNKFYRWCTDRLKINPTTRFILDRVAENQEAIVLLGTRSSESSTRAASIKKFEIKGKRLQKHVLPNVSVFSPIREVETNEVWQYLNQVPPPWGGSHKELVTLYRNANSGDCPLVIDETTPSCGNSRFGCWVCTVVAKDKSMEGLVDNGADWMSVLLDLRNFLVETRDNPLKYRQKEKRNGQTVDKHWGPYKFDTRVEILLRLLRAQKGIASAEGVELITHQEMVLIQYHWFRDCYFSTRVSDIYNQVYKTDLKIMGKQEEKRKQEQKLLKSSCKTEPKDVDLIQDLLALQKTKTLMIKKRGLQADIENRIEQAISENSKAS